MDIKLVRTETGTVEENGRTYEGDYRRYEIRCNTDDEQPSYVVEYTLNDYGTHTYRCITVSTNYFAHRDNYIPEIYFYDKNKWSDVEKAMFKIQTTAYGTMKVEEIDKIIAGLNFAKEVVARLTEMFL